VPDHTPTRFGAFALAALRIAAGIAFFTHGAQKLFGWFGGVGPDGGTVELMSRMGLAGIIEVTAGALITIGLLTRPLAFIASGEMAVAYFWAHVAGRGALGWWANGGELALLYAFIWLFFFAWGPGEYSVDAGLARDRTTTPPGAPGSSSPAT
jgi:putative oxidoreductase